MHKILLSIGCAIQAHATNQVLTLKVLAQKWANRFLFWMYLPKLNSNGPNLGILCLGLFGLILQSTNALAQGTTCPTATVITANGTFSGNVIDPTIHYYTFTPGISANVTLTLKDLGLINGGSTYEIYEDNASCSLSNPIYSIAPGGFQNIVYTFDILPNKSYVIKVNDDTFGVAGNQAYEFDVVFNVPDPGGVAGANLWYKADAGVTASGGFMSKWENKGSLGSTADAELLPTQAANSHPAYIISGTDQINFNPSVKFDGQNDFIQTGLFPTFLGNAADKNISQFIVYKKLGANNTFIWNIDNGLLASNSGGLILMGARSDGQLLQSGQRIDFPTPMAENEVALFDMVATTSSTASNQTFSLNKNGQSDQDAPANNYYSDNVDHPLRFGRFQNSFGHAIIAELVVYPTALSPGDRNKVHSYLALKYGLSLGNNQNFALFVNSAGTPVYSNATYKFDVFGIGKDDVSGLNQQQSNSMNTGSGDGTGQSGKGNIMLKNPSSLDNGDFLIIGHDNGALTEQTAEVPTAGQRRVAREWFVKRTGDPGTVDLSFDINGLSLTGTRATNFKLLVDTDGDFSSGATEINAASLTGTKVEFTGVSIPDGSYLTLVTNILTPAGPGVLGASLWLKADDGVSNSGGNLTGWTDQTGINTFTVNGSPGYSTDAINFNPVATFANAETVRSLPGDYLSGNTAITYQDGFAVFKKTNNASGALIGSATSGWAYGQVLFGGYTANDVYVSDGAYPGGSWLRLQNSSAASSNVAIVNYDLSGGNTSTAKASVNGMPQTLSAGGAGGVGSTFTLTPWIGGTNNTGGQSIDQGWPHFRGEVAEIILYPASLSENEKLKIQSYLAIKYGTTLDPSVTNYLSATGAVIWNKTSHWNDVFGLGKDDNGLGQTRSNSINTGSGDGTGQAGKANIVLSDPSALEVGDYLIIGHDNGALATQATDLPTSQSANLRLTREWKVQHTGDVGTVAMSISFEGITIPGNASDDLKLMVDNDGDGDFNTGTVNVVAGNLANDVFSVSNVVLPNNAVFTFVVGPSPPSPGAVGLPTIWLKADAGIEKSPTTFQVSKVINQGSINAEFVPFDVVRFNNVGLSTNINNLHPAFYFGGSAGTAYLKAENMPSPFGTSGANEVGSQFIVFKRLGGIDQASLYQYGSTDLKLKVTQKGVYTQDGYEISVSNFVRGKTDLMDLVSSVSSSSSDLVLNYNGVNVGSVTGSFQAGPDVGTFMVGNDINAPSNGNSANIYLIEIITFPKVLSPIERKKVQSYLAIKYGLPLGDNNNAVSYLSSAGTEVWPADNTYKYDVFGIAKDNATALDQPESFAARLADYGDGKHSISGKGNLVVNNATSLEDGDYLMIGHDNHALTEQITNVPSQMAGRPRFTRTWKVKRTGDPGTVSLRFDYKGLSLSGTQKEDFVLLIDADGDGDFTAGAVSKVADAFLTNSTTYITFNGVDLPDGALFTIITGPEPPSPGGVSGANLWYNAATGVTASGSSVSDWANQGSINANAAQATSANQPTLHSSGTQQINFNPSIGFDGSNDVLITPAISTLFGTDGSGNNVASQFIVFRQTGTQNTIIYSWDDISNAFLAAHSTGRMNQSRWRIDDNQPVLQNEVALVDMLATTSSTTNSFSLNKNGRQDQTQNNSFQASGGNLPFKIGRFASNVYGQADIAEILVYPQLLSPGDRNKVHSYLALKYGLSLGNNQNFALFVNSAGTPVYSDATYKFDVFGIGKDDRSGLNQTQSNNMNTGSGDGTGQIGKGNIVLRSPSSLDDGDFLLIGHNNGRLEFAPSSFNGYGQLSRKWKAKHTGDVGVVDFTISLAGLPTISSAKEDFELIIDTDGDGDYSTGPVTRVNASDLTSNVLVFSALKLPDNAVFTLIEKILASANTLNANRIIVNPSFETGSGVAGGAFPSSQGAGANAEIDGWYSTHPDRVIGGQNKIGPIEVWIGGDWRASPSDGQFYVELNAFEPSRLYQFVYLVNGEQFDWSYDHRKRTFSANPRPDRVIYSIYSADGAQRLATLDDYQNSNANAWTKRSGTATVNLPSGIYQIGFEANANGNTDATVGNFLDNVQIGLKTFVEFTTDTLRLTEGQTLKPHFFVNGEVKGASSIDVQVNEISATSGVDYTLANRTTTIPVGKYALADSVAIDLDIINDDIPKADRILELIITTKTGDIDERDANADGIYQRTLIVIIEDDDPCFSAGTSAAHSFCASDASSLDLFSLLGGSPDPGGQWSDPGPGMTTGIDFSDPNFDPKNVDFSGVAIGTYQLAYFQPSRGICPDVVTTLVINIREPFPMGQNASVKVCNDGTTLNLLSSLGKTSLGGTPNAGGVWTTRSKVQITDPTNVSFKGIPAGTYTFLYTTAGSDLNCAGGLASAELTVNVTQAANAGTANTVSVCDGGASTTLNLLTSLGGSPDAGGRWAQTGTNPSSVTLGDGTAVNFNGAIAGKYTFTYTVSGTSPCGDDTATLTVNVNQDHNAGSNAALTVCNDGSTVDLVTALGAHDPGGTWSNDDNVTGISLTNPSSVDFNGVPAGTYAFTYTITGEGICNDVAATISVTVTRAANAGTDNTVNVCDGGNSTTLNLLTSLGGSPDAGGSWSETSSTSSAVTVGDGTAVNFAGVSAGRYQFTYTVTGNNPCGNDTAVVTVNVNQLHNAGTPTTVTVCNDESSFDLRANLSGNPDPGGNWTLAGAGAVTNVVDLTGLASGDYVYTYTISGAPGSACGDVTSTLTVRLVKPANPGLDKNVTICIDNQPGLNLFKSLGGNPDPGGKWIDLDNAGVTIDQNDSTNFAGKADGDYRFEYLTSDPSQCKPASSTLTVKVTSIVDMGPDLSYTMCNDGSTLNLMDYGTGIRNTPDRIVVLGATGIDTSDPTNVSFVSAVFNGTSATVTFIFIGPRNAICASSGSGRAIDNARITVTVNRVADAGQANTVNVCDGGTSTFLDLFGSLNGTPETGGSWQEFVQNSGDPTSGVNIGDPSNVDFDGVAAGKYFFRYTVAGRGNCNDDSAVLTVNVNQDHDAGADATLLVCNDPSSTYDLFASLGGAPEAGGKWTDDDNTGINISKPNTVNFAGLAAGNYDFTYSIAGEGICNTVSATLTVTVVQAANAGTDNTVRVCDGGPDTTIDLFASLLGGPDTGGAWSEVTANGLRPLNSSSVDFNGVPAGRYIYQYDVTGSIPCADDSAQVVVLVDQVASLGRPVDILACVGDVKISLFAGLVGSVDRIGTWSDDDNSGLDISNPENIDISALAPGNYDFTYSVPANGSCLASSITTTLIASPPPNAGAPTIIEVCNGSLAAIVDVFGQVLGNPATGGSWYDVDGLGVDFSNPAAVDFSGVPVGGYSVYYEVGATGFCGIVSNLITINVKELPQLIIAGPIDICNDDTGIIDFSSLVNIGGGDWTDINNSGVDLSDLSAVSFNNVPPGAYTFNYQPQDDPVCGPIADDNIVITVFESLDAGLDATAEICADGTTLDLFAALGGTPDAGGVWNNKDGATVSLTDPRAVDFTGVSAGTYRFGYSVLASGNGPCTSKSSVLTVTVNALPNAGNDARVPLCVDPSGTIINLLDYLDINADAGGTWSDGSSSGAIIADPTAVDISGLVDGTYFAVYKVDGQGTCAADTATITLEVSTLANAGTSAFISICNDGSTVNLLDALGRDADAGGQWTDLNGAKVDLSNAASVDFNKVRPGQYKFEYTISGTGACPDVSAIVTVEVDQKANAGIPTTISVCDGGTSTTVNLFASLSGMPDAGGSWSESTSSGANITDPAAVDFNGVTAGRYVFTYTLAASGACGEVSTDLIINVNQDHNAGTNTTVEVCTSTTDFDLTTALSGSPDPGGRWLDISNSGLDLSDPTSVDLSALTTNTYDLRYVITGEGVCNNVEAILTLDLKEAVNAGTDANVVVCNGGAASVNLFTLLGADSGGTWTDNDGSGVTLGDGTNVSFDGTAAGTYTYTYSITGPGVCADDASTVTVNVTRNPNAGIDATVQVCNDGTTVDLFRSLGGTPDANGSWTDQSNSGVDISNVSTVSFSGVAAGSYQYTYTVLGSGPCTNQMARVTVEVSQAANAGKSNAIVVCNGGAGTTRNLFAAIKGNPDANGTWTDVNSSGVDLSNPNAVDFAGLAAGKYTYRYTVAGQNTCTDASVNITVNVDQEANAGTDTTVAVCNNEVDFDPFAVLNGNPDAGGNWVDIDNSGIQLSQLPKKLSLKGIAVGTYRLRYEILGDGICNAVSSILTLNISQGLFAGNPTTLDVCNDAGVVDLQSALGATASVGGTWTDVDGAGVDLSNAKSVNFTGISAGSYDFTYTLTGDNACPGDTNTITVRVTQAVNAGSDHHIDLCNIGSYDLNSSLDTKADVGGIWSQTTGPSTVIPNGSMINVEHVTAGEYMFTYQVTGTGPCASDVSNVIITIFDSPDAGLDNTISVCDGGNGTVVDLFTSLNGTPAAGGTWTDLSTSGVDLTDPSSVDFDAIPGGLYQFQYTVSSSGPCQAATAFLYVRVDQDANAGIDTSVAICNDGTLLNFESLLDGNQDPGGTWTDLSNSGIDLSSITSVDVSSLSAGTYAFQYEISGTGVCNTVSKVLSITLFDPVNAGSDASLQVCNDGSRIDLLGALGNNVSTGGTWTDLNNAGVNLSNANAVSFNGIAQGQYRFRYSVASNGPCGADEAIISVNVIQLPNAGASATLQVCNDTATYNLLQAIGNPQAGGTWSDNNASGINLSNPSSVVFSGLAPGTYNYTYAVSNSGNCITQSTLTVVVTQKLSAGLNHAIYVCAGGAGTIRNLFTSLLGNPYAGGTWTDDDSSGVDLTDPTSVEFAGLAAGVYDFTYTVNGPNACQSASAKVEVHIDQVIDAGTDNTIEVCNDNGAVDLFDSIAGNPRLGGSWTDNNGAGVDLTNPYAVDFTSVNAGTYTFTYAIAGDGICAGAASTLTVNVNRAANAGTNATLAVCNLAGSANLDLFTALGGADPGGTWQDADNAGVNLLDPTNVDFDGVSAGSYQFKYVVDGPGICRTASAIVTVNVTNSPNAGTGTSGTILNNGSTLDLTSLLRGADLGGRWSDTNNSGAIISDPTAASFAGVVAGNYTFTYTLTGTSPCGAVSTTVTVVVQNAANAGQSTRITLCSEDASSLNLYTLLNGNPSNTGTWNPVGFKVKSFDPTSVDLSKEKTGAYVFNYIVKNPGSIDKSSLTIDLFEKGNAGIGNSITNEIITCNSGSDPIDLFSILSGNPDLDGVWSEPIGPSTVDVSNPRSISFIGAVAGFYEFDYTVISDGSCSVSVARVYIEVQEGANAGNSTVIEICNGDSNLVDLFAQLTGNPDSGGAWTDPNGSPVIGADAISFFGLPAASYVFTYTIQPTGSCTNPVSSTVTVNVQNQANAGTDNRILLSFRDSPIINLFESLGGNPDRGGQWFDDSGTGLNIIDPNSVDFSGIADGVYSFRYRIDDQNLCNIVEAVLTVEINFVAVSEQDTEVIEGFSPDGDGINEFWTIENIDQFPRNSVKVFNRWGHLVFEMKSYNNTGRVFDGFANAGTVIGNKPLPTGTYFYIIDFGDGSTLKKGFITILR